MHSAIVHYLVLSFYWPVNFKVYDLSGQATELLRVAVTQMCMEEKEDGERMEREMMGAEGSGR